VKSVLVQDWLRNEVSGFCVLCQNRAGVVVCAHAERPGSCPCSCGHRVVVRPR